MSETVPSHRLKRAKRALRRDVLALREALSAQERATKSRTIADRLLALPELTVAHTVLAFWSFGSEVETAPLLAGLASRGTRIALPRLELREILPVTYRPGDPLAETTFGAMEPIGGAVVPPAEVDVVVTPGVAFDRRGHRVGYGEGFYDRFLPRTRPDAFRVAIAFDLQVVTAVPHGRVDVAVAAVVTEGEVIRCLPP